MKKILKDPISFFFWKKLCSFQLLRRFEFTSLGLCSFLTSSSKKLHSSCLPRAPRIPKQHNSTHMYNIPYQSRIVFLGAGRMKQKIKIRMKKPYNSRIIFAPFRYFLHTNFVCGCKVHQYCLILVGSNLVACKI